jgi:hypothetical protein
MLAVEAASSKMEALQVREYAVDPALAAFVKSVWSLESDGRVCEPARERILPDGCVELVFHFNDPFRSYFANGDSAVQPRSFVVGQMKRFLEIEPAGRAGFVAVRFLARGAYLFFHRPLSEVAAGVVDLEDLWPGRAREWTEQLALARSMTARVRLVRDDEFVETFALSQPGKDFATYSETRFRRRR